MGKATKDGDRHKGAEKPVSIPMEFEDAVAALLRAPKDDKKLTRRQEKKPVASSSDTGRDDD